MTSVLRIVFASVFTLLANALPLNALAENGPEGTWRLVSRVLPDGTKQVPPEVIGIGSYVNGQRNLNVMWRTQDGKVASYSLMSTVTVTNAEYTETLAFSLLNDPTNPQNPIVNTKAETKTTPIQREGGRVSYKLPFDAPSVVIEGDKMIATAKGMFVDQWERIK